MQVDSDSATHVVDISISLIVIMSLIREEEGRGDISNCPPQPHTRLDCFVRTQQASAVATVLCTSITHI